MTDLKRFEYVLALSECMNFSQAATQLKISQSTLSQYIQKIEKEIGITLFDRSATPMKLTQFGEIYVKGARKIIDVYNEMLDSINDADSGACGTLRVGLSPSRATFLLPQVISKFNKSYPNVKLKFLESKTSDIIKNLADGNIDFAYTVTSGFEKYEDYAVLPAEKEQIMLVTSAEYSQKLPSKGGVVDFEDAAGMRFILLEDSQVLTDEFYALCRKSGVSPEIYISVSEISTAISFVRSGMGVMLLPSSYRNYGKLKDELNFYNIKQADGERDIAIIYKKDKYINKPMKALVDILCNK